jgi:hypothetical protein
MLCDTHALHLNGVFHHEKKKEKMNPIRATAPQITPNNIGSLFLRIPPHNRTLTQNGPADHTSGTKITGRNNALAQIATLATEILRTIRASKKHKTNGT